MGEGGRAARKRAARRTRAVVLALQIFCCGIPGKGESSASMEMKRKAGFVAKMLHFVDWPAEGSEARQTAFRFCVAGDGFLSFAFSEELRGTNLRGREVEVRTVQKDGGLDGCEAIYFAGSGKAANEKWLQKLKGGSVLTFGEEKGFLEEGGMVRITYANGNVQFEVNLDCVRSAGLKINSRLLALAKGVTKTGRPVSN